MFIFKNEGDNIFFYEVVEKIKCDNVDKVFSVVFGIGKELKNILVIIIII